MVVFDGGHRLKAIEYLLKTDNINLSICCYIYAIDIDKDINKEIAKHFKIINSNTPIPDIYYDLMNDQDNEELIKKKDIIEDAYSEYKIVYAKFYSKAAKCHRPNFNDTTFKDLCHTLTFKTLEELLSKLQRLNEDKKQKKEMILKKALEKCEKYNFYLFG